jgi:putative transcriptional regulator
MPLTAIGPRFRFGTNLAFLLVRNSKRCRFDSLGALPIRSVNAMNSLQGHVLVASPRLVESPFFRTVVLVLQHTDEGAWGVVLNRPAGQRICDFWSQVSDEPCQAQRQLSLGGPVSGPVIALHSCLSCAEAQVPPGVYLASHKDNLARIVQQELPFRLFVGHAGWQPGQLELELGQGVWLVGSPSVDDVFANDYEMWRLMLKSVGDAFARDVLKIKHVPQDVSWN